MSFSHVVIAPIPKNITFEDKKTRCDVAVLQQELDNFVHTLRESGVNTITLSNAEETVPIGSLFTGDTAVAINGTALVCRPKRPNPNLAEISRILSRLSWITIETPETLNGKPVVLEASDVIFTGSEIFVGIRKHGTNDEGAQILGRVFCDYCVVPIYLSDKAHPLTYYVSIAAPGVLAVGTSKEAKAIVRKIEQNATRHQTLTIENDAAVNCLNVNKRVIFRQNLTDRFNSLKSLGVELWPVNISEFYGVGGLLSRFCLLVAERPMPSHSSNHNQH